MSALACAKSACAGRLRKRQSTGRAAMVLLLFCFGGTAGCGPTSVAGSGKPPSAKDAIILVATERASQGGRLVTVSSDGARQSALATLPAGVTTLDRSPVFAPDGFSLVFVSNRDRMSLSETSLWFLPADGEPRRLTNGEAIDRDPRISPDGKWLYFCSNRGGSFDVYRAAFSATGTMGELERVTDLPDQILSPSLSPDAREIVYMAVNAEGESSIWRARVDGSGEASQLTPGPMDMTPAWGQDNAIAFASRAVGRNDADLFLIDADGSNRRSLIDAPNTDETGPQWSHDGRYLFAIGMYRSAHDGKPILGSIVFVDMKEKVRRLRALHDPSAVESRIGLALVPGPLDAKAMRKNEAYADALRKVLLHSAVQNEKERRRMKQDE